MTKVTPFLMFNDQLEASLELYTAVFPGTEVKNIARDGQNGPVTSAEFIVGGQHFMAYNGGPHFRFSEGFSMFDQWEAQMLAMIQVRARTGLYSEISDDDSDSATSQRIGLWQHVTVPAKYF